MGLPAAKAETLQQTGNCPTGMVEVEGDYCPWLDQVCIKRPEKMSYRCSEYAHPADYGKCQTGTAHKHFCMDVYEYPNKAGEMPEVWKSWYDARDACQAQGKRLCTEDEWTLACEGPEHLPYPYGFKRDATACNIDKDHPTVDEAALKDPAKRQAELARLWQGEASGARDKCVSPFGVHDMTGNVDEWTVNETGKPHNSALKGGYWSWVRGRCRAVTPGHEEGFKYYQIGFRCCANPGGDGKSKPAPTPAPVEAKEQPIAPPPPPAPTPPPIAAKEIIATPKEPVASPKSDAPRGSIALPASADGHRIYVDGKVVAAAPAAVFVPCGHHVLRIGSQGRDQEIDVPCGGRITATYP